ncbi:MAG TPA: hypothetical protein VMU77_08045 [Acidimicrobiales bacterium]|nr:hypothetical protein [Acidimicrobiales bacterium]
MTTDGRLLSVGAEIGIVVAFFVIFFILAVRGLSRTHQIAPRGLAASAVRGIGARGEAPTDVTALQYGCWWGWTGPSGGLLAQPRRF